MVALDKLVLSIIVFFVFIIGGVFLVNDVEISYVDDNVDMELNEYINETYLSATGNNLPDVPSSGIYTVNSSEDVYNLGKNTQARMFDKEVDEQDTESSMFSGSFSVIRLITTPVRLINSVVNQIANRMEIPPVFIQYGFAALIISVIFGVIYLIFRVKGGS